LLGKAKSANPDVVYMISNDEEEAALLVQQAKGLGFKPKVFVGAAAGFTLPEFCKLAGDAAENVYALTLWTPQVHYPGQKNTIATIRKSSGPKWTAMVLRPMLPFTWLRMPSSGPNALHPKTCAKLLQGLL
jgi:ABC-type branched-subunit amino acid transport system substrate-binding protein